MAVLVVASTHLRRHSRTQPEVQPVHREHHEARQGVIGKRMGDDGRVERELRRTMEIV